VCARHERKGIERYRYIPGSESLSLASWWSQLASDKVVYREVDTEGSQTAKSGTDKQEGYTEVIQDG
jgi:hypothetical protein